MGRFETDYFLKPHLLNQIATYKAQFEIFTHKTDCDIEEYSAAWTLAWSSPSRYMIIGIEQIGSVTARA